MSTIIASLGFHILNANYLRELPLERVNHPHPTLTLLLYACLFLAWFGWQINPAFLANKSKFAVRKKDRSSLYSSSYSSQVNSFFLFMLAYLISFSVFVFILIRDYQINAPTWYLPLIAGGIAIYHFAKYLIYRVLIVPVFSSPIPVAMVIQSYMFINITTGLLLIPASIGLIYVNNSSMHQVFTIFGIIILVFYLLSTLIRMFYIFFNNISSLVYLILYLCALEIVPLLMVLKFIYEKLIIIE